MSTLQAESLSVTALDSVMAIIKEYLTAHQINDMTEVFKKDISKRSYDCLFDSILSNCIIGEPDNIIDLLNKLEELDRFSTDKALPALVAFACLEALARGRPREINQGSWEKIIFTIVGYSCELESHRDDLINLKDDIHDRTTDGWILESCSPELSPNPCLRLEMFRFMRIFKLNCSFPITPKAFRTSVISTLCELHDTYPTLVATQVKQCTAMDLMYAIQISSLQIGNNVNTYYYPKQNRIEIIAAIVKISAMFALLEEERNNHDFRFQIENACLHFCGLIPDLNHDLPDFATVVCKKSILQNYVADALRFITCTFSRFDTSIIAIEKRDRILGSLVTEEERLRLQFHGITPARVSEDKMSYFTKLSNRDDRDDDMWWRGDLCIFQIPFMTQGAPKVYTHYQSQNCLSSDSSENPQRGEEV